MVSGDPHRDDGFLTSDFGETSKFCNSALDILTQALTQLDSGAVVTSMSALKLVGGIFFAYCSMILPGAAHLRLNSGELGFLDPCWGLCSCHLSNGC